MAQVKVFVTKSGDLSSVPRTHLVEGDNDSYWLSSEAIWVSITPNKINTCNLKGRINVDNGGVHL